MFKNIFSADGRIRRTEYGESLMIASTAALALEYLAMHYYRDTLFYFGWLPSALFIISQGAKRCHDMGKRGWFQFIPFYIILMIFEDGEKGYNHFGANPKGEGDFELSIESEDQTTANGL